MARQIEVPTIYPEELVKNVGRTIDKYPVADGQHERKLRSTRNGVLAKARLAADLCEHRLTEVQFLNCQPDCNSPYGPHTKDCEMARIRLEIEATDTLKAELKRAIESYANKWRQVVNAGRGDLPPVAVELLTGCEDP